ncbi:MAG: RNA polymerase sigma-70 factor [Bacteroidota bacterium]
MNSRTLTSRRLQSANSDRDVKAFQEIFHNHYSDLCLYASRFVGGADTAKDIVQDVLVRFWEEKERLRHKNAVKSYLFTAVKNRSLNHLKREKRGAGISELLFSFEPGLADPDEDNAFSTLSFNNLQRDLEQAIDEMPEQRRIIFRLSRFDQLKTKEIAEKLKISPRTVETQIYRSLKTLREKLRHHL